MLKEAMRILDVKEDVLHPFDAIDTFNGDQQIEGVLCHQGDHRYGALVIFRVGGLNVEPQRIYCTPKLHYPFDRTEGDRRYKFPKAIRIEAYEKLDGTNVCCYRYRDASGKSFTTFKTRLTPILPASRFGNFAEFWRRLLRTDPELAALVNHPILATHSLSFEMYGYLNPILVVYDVDIAARLLFAVRQDDAAVMPPHLVGGPVALRPEAIATSDEGLVKMYEDLRASVDRRNERLPDDGGIKGTEGYVFYLLEASGRWSQWKCKGASIEAVHWSSAFIPESIIYPTARNALEQVDDLTVEAVKALLLEEFTAVQVETSSDRIGRVVEDIRNQQAFKARVRAAYVEFGFTDELKAAKMRAMSTRFSRGEMKIVFSALRTMGLV